MGFSLVVIFLYGSVVWAFFLNFPGNISWEGHVSGAVSELSWLGSSEMRVRKGKFSLKMKSMRKRKKVKMMKKMSLMKIFKNACFLRKML